MRKERETKTLLDAYFGEQPMLPKYGSSKQSEYEGYVMTYKPNTWNIYIKRIHDLAEKGTLVDYSSATSYRSGVFYLN